MPAGNKERNRTRLCGSIKAITSGIVVKCSYEHRGKGINQDTHQLGHSGWSKGYRNARPFALSYFGAQVLTDKRSRGHSKAGDGKEAEPFYFGIGAAACHGHFC